MDYLEIEKKLQESADNVKTRDFSEIWAVIGPKIAQEQAKQKEKERKLRIFKKWALLTAPLLCIIIAVSIILPIALNNKGNQHLTYYVENLQIEEVNKDKFLEDINKSTLKVFDFSSYQFVSSVLYYAETSEIKGGRVEIYNLVEQNPSWYIKLIFYSKDVLVDDAQFSELNLEYTTSSNVEIDYKFNSVENIYYVYAQYKDINYYIEYMPLSMQVTDFFETFFK